MLYLYIYLGCENCIWVKAIGLYTVGCENFKILKICRLLLYMAYVDECRISHYRNDTPV